MPPKTKPEAASRSRESQASLLSEFVRQGTESFFATQRILLDLATRQNTTTVEAIRDRLYNVRTAPVEALTEMAGEGMSNFIAAQRVLLQPRAAPERNAAERRRGTNPELKPVGAMAELLRRGIDTFIDMQQHFLTMVAKQADVWVDNTKDGKPFEGKGMPEIAREAMENFVRSQKKFLDAVAEETAHAMGAKDGQEHRAGKKTEVAELARQGTRSLHRRAEEVARHGLAADGCERQGDAPHDRDAESAAARHARGSHQVHGGQLRVRPEGAAGSDGKARPMPRRTSEPHTHKPAPGRKRARATAAVAVDQGRAATAV